eukprot:scaffold36875_cov25-Tisochrysis_lutea.AAC.3
MRVCVYVCVCVRAHACKKLEQPFAINSIHGNSDSSYTTRLRVCLGDMHPMWPERTACWGGTMTYCACSCAKLEERPAPQIPSALFQSACPSC